MDSVFCVLLNLALWLELSSQRFLPYVFNFSKDTTVPSGGKKAKNRAMDVLRVVLRELDLDLQEGEVGTHPIRKCASTHVRSNDVSKDDKDTRGRWKTTGRVSDRYDSVQLPYIDTKVASALCIGGACTYVLNEAVVSPQHVLHCVIPAINENYATQVALVLGMAALLWCICSPLLAHLVPIYIKDRVNASIELPEGVNPVERCFVVVTGDNDNMSLTQVSPEEEATMVAQGTGTGTS
jgi:hypothetical protein